MKRLTRGAEEGGPWVVFADIVLATLFIFVLFIFAQYIKYDKLAVLEELDERKEEIRQLIQDSVPGEDSVAVVAGQEFSQRIKFSSDLLFATCDDRLRPAGRDVVFLVGTLLNTRSDYFKSIEVEGHTDPRPPTGEEECPFRDNWELSSRRAATVVRILARDAEMEPARLSSVGRAQFQQPEFVTDTSMWVGDRSDEDPWRPFRRIEMVLQYSEEDIRTSLRSSESVNESEGFGTGG